MSLTDVTKLIDGNGATRLWRALMMGAVALIAIQLWQVRDTTMTIQNELQNIDQRVDRMDERLRYLERQDAQQEISHDPR